MPTWGAPSGHKGYLVLPLGYFTYSHRGRGRARARACARALPSCSDASEAAVAFTAAPHCAASFEFSAASADTFVVRLDNAAASSAFAAASFAFCAVSPPILAAHLRRAFQDSCRGVERCLPRGMVHVAMSVRHAACCMDASVPIAWL